MELFKTWCYFCGGILNLQRDEYRSQTDTEGTKRYWHMPACVEAQKEVELQRKVRLARTVH